MVPTSSPGVLISIRPEFVVAIAEGRKTVELRRSFPLLEAGTLLVIYSTLPVGAVVGFAPIRAVHTGSVDAMWRKHGLKAALDRKRYQDYFSSRTRAFAIELGPYSQIDPVPLSDIPTVLPGIQVPQSWRYLDQGCVDFVQTRGEGLRAHGPARV